MLGWSLLHYARCIMAGSGSKSCLFSAVPECLYLTQISCLCVLLLNSGYVRLLGVNLTSHIQLFEHLGAYVRGAFMCRVLNLQPLPIWNLLERPWWWSAASPLLSPLRFLLASLLCITLASVFARVGHCVNFSLILLFHSLLNWTFIWLLDHCGTLYVQSLTFKSHLSH